MELESNRPNPPTQPTTLLPFHSSAAQHSTAQQRSPYSRVIEGRLVHVKGRAEVVALVAHRDKAVAGLGCLPRGHEGVDGVALLELAQQVLVAHALGQATDEEARLPAAPAPAPPDPVRVALRGLGGLDGQAPLAVLEVDAWEGVVCLANRLVGRLVGWWNAQGGEESLERGVIEGGADDGFFFAFSTLALGSSFPQIEKRKKAYYRLPTVVLLGRLQVLVRALDRHEAACVWLLLAGRQGSVN